MLPVGEAVRELMFTRRPAHEIERIAGEVEDFKTLEEKAVEKALRGVTTLEEVASPAMD